MIRYYFFRPAGADQILTSPPGANAPRYMISLRWSF